MAPQKGKQGTRGAKQIVAENKSTLGFYQNMIFGSNAVYLTVTCVFSDLFRWDNVFLLVLAAIVDIASIQFMTYMAKPKYSDSNQVIDSGVDLNMEGGIAEHVKDLIILTSITQVLSLYSKYFWLLWLLAPARAGWIAWKNFISPWLSQPTQGQEISEKKQRKLERKMKGRH